jgi:hypothetical protein
MRVNTFKGMLLLSLMIIAALLIPSAYASSTKWTIQTINKDIGLGGSPCIAIDSSNNPHIAYIESLNGGDSLMYGSWNGLGWDIQNVTEAGGAVALALDSNGNPRIAFTSSSGLMYASLENSVWRFQTVASEGGYPFSLALDSEGNPHIAYLNAPSYALNYASWTGKSWSITTVDNFQNFAFNTVSLALDSSGNPHILYGYDVQTENSSKPGTETFYNLGITVKYATLTGSGWSVQTVGSNIVDFGNMVLDSGGNPHFTYVAEQPSNNAQNLIYASWNGQVWSNQIVVENYRGFEVSYLALNSHNYPLIEYQEEFTQNSSTALMLSRWSGTNWNTQIITTGSQNTGPLAVDSNGDPHIIYVAQTSQVIGQFFAYSLNYATTSINSISTSASAILWIALALPAIIITLVAAFAYLALQHHRKSRSESNSDPPTHLQHFIH